jgi:YegS/Rv2252/BmrU family lipid kinase
LEYELVQTQGPEDATRIARAAAGSGYDVVVAVGGDGTANEVLNGLVEAKHIDGAAGVSLGLIAVGRGNDFAFGVGVPKGVETGCRLLAADHRRTMDVGRAVGGLFPQGRYFGNGVGIGFDAVVGFEALKLKRLSGFPSYIVATLKTVFLYFAAPLLRIAFDGQVLEQPSLMVSVMNGRRMGGGFMMAPQGDPGDGLLDLCIARQVSKLGVFALIPRFMNGTQATHPKITIARARQVDVTALSGTLPAHADGETLCTEGQRLSIELLPQELSVICEAPSA